MPISLQGWPGRSERTRTLRRLRERLRDGVESIRRLDRDALAAAGADPALLDDPQFVPAVAALEVPMLVDLLKQPASPWLDDRRTPRKETRDEIVRRAFADAVAKLRERLGDDAADWRWGDLHTVTLVHTPFGQSGIKPLEWIFNGATRPVGGHAFTVNQAMYDPLNPYAVTFGSSQRLIVDLSGPDETLAVNSTGASGHAFHHHRDDETERWLNVELHPLPFSREGVESFAEAKLVLRP